MANKLADLVPKIYAQSALYLRSNTAMIANVNADYGDEAKEKGEVILVPMAGDVATTDVQPGPYAPEAGDIAPTVAEIKLDQWKEAAFNLTEREYAAIIAGTIPMQMEAAVASLADTVNAFLFSKYKKSYGFIGTPGTTPFGSPQDAINARKVLSIMKAPLQNRHMIISPEAEAKALGLENFIQAQMSADPNVVREGDLGRKLGFYWHMDQNVPTHVSTPLSAGAATVAVSASKGTNVVVIAKATNASPLVAGDIITFAGDAQTYVVVKDTALAVGNTPVEIMPALKVAKAGGETVSLIGTHVVNLAMHRDAIAFASRPLINQDMGGEEIEMSMSAADPQSKLAFRVCIRKEYHRTRVGIDALYGADCVRPQLITRVAG